MSLVKSTVKSEKAVKPTASTSPDWYDLLFKAVLEPAQLVEAHKHFRRYSLANQWLAATQLTAKGKKLQPINTFKGWKGVDRVVQRGEKAAIALIMPVPIKSKKKKEDGEEDEVRFTRFMLRNFWFCLDQTDGEEFTPTEVDDGNWEMSAALDFLEINESDFEFSSISVPESEGYVEGRAIHVSPLAIDRDLERIRKSAHILLGHYESEPRRHTPSDPSLQRIEAEAVTYLVAATLELDNLESIRAQMQKHLSKEGRKRVPEQIANRAFAAADKFINAGYC